jgi:2-polyprenyl-3-methyl-5-hydroxy-6-metoxy-1,4-benzoquinol methylase
MENTYFEISKRADAAQAESAGFVRSARASTSEPHRAEAAPAYRAPGRRQPIEYLPFPPTSLPHRDLLVLEQLAIGEGERVCEVGVGSGGTAVRVARLGAAEVLGLDVSADAIAALRDLERRHTNLRLDIADVTKLEEIHPIRSRFDLVYSCDTLEHVKEPDAYFRAMFELLVPRGRCFITFPNEPPEIMHGITRFDSPSDLEARLSRAGLAGVELGAARLTPRAARVVDHLGRRPLALVRTAVHVSQRLRGRGRDKGAARAQRFEETSFHEHRRLWQAMSPAVNLYWYAVLRLMAGRGPAFDIDWGFRRTPFEDCQIVIRGVKP